MADIRKLEKLARLVRWYILKMTTRAGSGHLTSSLSATDVMVALFFNKIRLIGIRKINMLFKLVYKYSKYKIKELYIN